MTGQTSTPTEYMQEKKFNGFSEKMIRCTMSQIQSSIAQRKPFTLVELHRTEFASEYTAM